MPRPSPEHISRPSFTKWYDEHVGFGPTTPYERQDLRNKMHESGVGDTRGEEAIIRAAYNRFAPHYNKIMIFPAIKITADYVFSHVRLHGKMNLLSAQSGTAFLENFIAKHQIPEGKVISLDISDKMNEIGKDLSRKENVKNIQFITGTSNKMPINSKTQDAILLLSPKVHGQNQLLPTLRECRRVIKNSQHSRIIYANKVQSQKDINDYINAFHQAGFKVIHNEILQEQQTGLTILFLTARPKS